jgi:CRISPR/Cas system-associated endonuclease Cas1
VVWRSVIISQPAKLKREHFSLVIEQVQSARVPFEDIAIIVLIIVKLRSHIQYYPLVQSMG